MKKILSVILAAIMIFAMLPNVSATTDKGNYDEENAILLSKTLKIMVGDENGNLRLGDYVSRAEFTKVAIAMSQYRNMVPPSSTTSFFKDVSFRHWAAPYVRLAVTNGLITGYPDGTFRPEDTVLLEEAVTVMLKLLGFTSEDFGSSWPYGQIGIATNQHVLDNITCPIGSQLTRGDVLKLVYNTLVAQPKSAQISDDKYLQSLDCNVYEDAVLIATNRENDGVAPGYILTSEGTFRLGDGFDHDLIGRKGDLIVINGNDYAAFMQSVQLVQKHVVYSVTDSTIITYCDGVISGFEADNGIEVYQDTTRTNFGSVRNTLSGGDAVYIMKNASGNVDYIILATDNMEGPYTYGSSQLSTLGIDTKSATIMRDGIKSGASSLEVNDIVYYLREINTVFAYSRKITGVYEKASPNRDMPTSVIVSGNEYRIESPAAFDKLSSVGSTKYGDTITLLLGKDGQIADVITDSAEMSGVVAGYLTATGTKEYTNADGELYTAMYAALVKPDGSQIDLVVDKNYDYHLNNVMEVELNDGIATLSKASGNKVYGIVDADKMEIGDIPVDDNVEILDVTHNENDYPGSYVRTYMQRLDGINLQNSKVLYSKINSSGKITELILFDVTGDAYEYGIVSERDTSKTYFYREAREGETATHKLVDGKYVADDGPEAIYVRDNDTNYNGYTITSGGNTYFSSLNYGTSLSSGTPVGLEFSGSSIKSIMKLTSAGSVKKIGEGYVTIGNTTYLTSDSLVAYKPNLSFGVSTYTIMPLSELKGNEDKYTISAYYDKLPSKGGRVRLLIVKEK